MRYHLTLFRPGFFRPAGTYAIATKFAQDNVGDNSDYYAINFTFMTIVINQMNFLLLTGFTFLFIK